MGHRYELPQHVPVFRKGAGRPHGPCGPGCLEAAGAAVWEPYGTGRGCQRGWGPQDGVNSWFISG